MNNYTYRAGEDPDNPCILIPRYRAVGRVAPNGKRYGKVSTKKEDDLVEVRSVVSKTTDLNTVTPDLIGTQYSFTEGAGIGTSFGTSLTEAITQNSLSLKHGGHEKLLDRSAYLIAPKDCTFREEGKWIYLKVRGGELKYPRPENFISVASASGDNNYKEGEVIGTAYNTISPISKLNNMVKLLRANGSVGKRYYEKDNVIISDCYAYEDGEIHYKETKSGDIEVTIGSRFYDYNSNIMYLFPDGAKIKKHQRFCSGLCNMGHVAGDLGNDIRNIYLIFRKQFYELQDKGYISNGYVDDHTTQEEIVEMLFISLINVEHNPKDQSIKTIDYLGTGKGILNNDSFYTTLSYGYSSKVVSKALKGKIHMNDDVMTETVLGLLLNNKLD